jgi:hypothetical protein
MAASWMWWPPCDVRTLRAKTARSLEVSLLPLLIAWALQETEARWVRQL